jgi:2-oxoisovalerate dehydrogenase E2 component (dihydrolipoyl transacylase)
MSDKLSSEGLELDIQIPLSRNRRTMARRMAKAHDQVLRIPLFGDANVHQWWWRKERDVTIRIIRALVQGCIQEPILNSWFHAEEEKPSLEVRSNIDLGLAVNTEHGLLVPVIRDVARVTYDVMREIIKDFKSRAKQRKIKGEEMANPTISLSNIGAASSGAVRYVNPVIVPPQVAILATASVRENVVVSRDTGKPAAEFVMPLSFVFDHRVITGVEATNFFEAVVTDLEKAD